MRRALWFFVIALVARDNYCVSILCFSLFSAVLSQPLSSDNKPTDNNDSDLNHQNVTSREKGHAPLTKQSLCTELSNEF